jgi:hypothetical protein
MLNVITISLSFAIVRQPIKKNLLFIETKDFLKCYNGLVELADFGIVILHTVIQT